MELLKYFDRRFHKPKSKTSGKFPFITISRETGCGATDIAKKLVREFKARDAQWKYIDKDVLNDSANRLNLDKSKIKYVFEAEKKTHADEILSAWSNRYYKSDRVVRKAISDVVKSMAEDGRVVLVGRGGAAITAGMKKGIHIRLIAPESWRVDSLIKRKNESRKETESFVADSDSKRKKLMAYFCDKKPKDMCFDLTINCAKFSKNQIVEIILNAMEQKKLI